MAVNKTVSSDALHGEDVLKDVITMKNSFKLLSRWSCDSFDSRLPGHASHLERSQRGQRLADCAESPSKFPTRRSHIFHWTNHLPPSCRKNLKLETSEQFLNRGLIQGCNHPKLWSSYVRSRRYVGPTFRNHHYGSYLSHQPDAIFSFRFMTETPKAPDIGQRLTSVSKHIFICHYIDDRTRYSREQKFCHGKELHVYYRRCSDFLVFTT